MSKNYFGDHLISEGVITREQFEQALLVQSEKPYLRIGEILFSMGFISFPKLDQYLKDFHRDILIGQLLIYRGVISQADLEKALNIQERQKGLLGDILVEAGVCTHAQIERVLSMQQLYRKNFDNLLRDSEKDE